VIGIIGQSVARSVEVAYHTEGENVYLQNAHILIHVTTDALEKDMKKRNVMNIVVQVCYPVLKQSS